MIKGVIFDLDDTIVNSNPLHTEAWNQLLNTYNHSLDDIPKNLRANQLGVRVIDTAKFITNYLNLKDDVETVYKKRVDYFLQLVDKKLELMPGILHAIKLFRKHCFQLAIATSGTKQYVNLVLLKFHLKNYFEVIITGDDVKKGKPDPETYLMAAKKLHLDPLECLVVEDSTKGIESAKAAGCKCIAVKNPYIPPQDLDQTDLVINSLNELTMEMIQERLG